jgi:hypothetical protein
VGVYSPILMQPGFSYLLGSGAHLYGRRFQNDAPLPDGLLLKARVRARHHSPQMIGSLSL